MKTYAIAFAVGVLAGVLYGVLGVRSPAPPIIALVGLLGILAGEQLPPLVRHLVGGARLDVAAVRDVSSHHVFGSLPTRRREERPPPADGANPGIGA